MNNQLRTVLEKTNPNLYAHDLSCPDQHDPQNKPNYKPKNRPLMSSRPKPCRAERSVAQWRELFLKHREAIPYYTTVGTVDCPGHKRVLDRFEKTNPIPKSTKYELPNTNSFEKTNPIFTFIPPRAIFHPP